MKRGRAQWFEPGDLTPSQATLYDAIANGPRSRGPQSFPLTDPAGRLEGPFNAMLYEPAIGTALQELGRAIRYGGHLPERTRELAILELAKLRRSEFEWYAHERVGRAAGLTGDEIAAVFAGTDAPSLTREETLVRELVRAFVRDGDIVDEIFSQARALLGEPALMEIVTLVGYYDLLALSLRFWRTPLPDGADPVFETPRP